MRVGRESGFFVARCCSGFHAVKVAQRGTEAGCKKLKSPYYLSFFKDARVAELVDAPDLGSGSFGSEGSTPFARTIFSVSGFRHQNHCLNHTNSEQNNNKCRWCLFWCLFFFRKVFFRQIVFPGSRLKQSTDSRSMETQENLLCQNQYNRFGRKTHTTACAIKSSNAYPGSGRTRKA